jgi:hypothetical protein
MKNIILLILGLVIYGSVFSQEVLSKQDYLEKSRNQKKTGKILLAGGSVLSAIGLGIVLGNLNGLFDPSQPEPNNDGTVGEVLGYSGLVIAATSIPLFIASSKNKKKAMSMTLDSQKIPQMKNNNFVYRAIPSLTIKLNL